MAQTDTEVLPMHRNGSRASAEAWLAWARTGDDPQDWHARIRNALLGNGFVLHAQPVIEVSTGAVVRHELLLRMVEDGRLIPPARFLPHAESCGLITDIDYWVLDRGIRIAGETPVAINLSAKTLSDPRLGSYIRGCLIDHGTEPTNVVFEITETAAVGRLGHASRLAQELTDVGCSFLLDDFGTGFGSFTYLQRLPLSGVKIDVSFVRGMAEDPADRRIVEAIVSVARRLDLQTIAEGVEDQETFDLLASMGVDFAQGFHLGRPARLADIRRLRPARQATVVGRRSPVRRPKLQPAT
ncbi:MAG: EAL domain-containing protein [Actinomycetota bacterium]